MPSSVIRGYTYRPEDRTLLVTFTSGRRYAYFAVPAPLYQKMREATSKGEFFNVHIRGHFSYARET